MKDVLAIGDSPGTVLRRALVLCACLVPLGTAFAGPCPPAVALTGAPELVAKLAEVLGARGLTIDPPACPAVHVRVEEHAAGVRVVIERPNAAPIERTTGELATAATLIESWTRKDVEAPLLAAHELPRTTVAVREPRAAPPVRTTVIVHAPASSRGVLLFAAAETSIASDRTSWLGAQLGACVKLGPVCAAARLRLASVIGGPGVWDEGLERRGTELLVGVDVPFRLGRHTLSPGFAAGLGWMHTRMESIEHAGGETGGLRADTHLTLSIALGRRLALDLSIAGDLTQATHIETWSMVQLPDEPRALVRFGAGVRYGGL